MFNNNQIDTDSLPKIEALDFKLISKNYFKIILLNLALSYGVIISLMFTLKQFIKNTFFHTNFWYFIIVLIILFLIQLFFYKLGFKKRKYALREKDITFSHGYLSNSTTTLPFNRIQHLEISRTFIARKLGLSTLKIYSAGESGGDIIIKGLPKNIADSQYAFLTHILNERV